MPGPPIVVLARPERAGERQMRGATLGECRGVIRGGAHQGMPEGDRAIPHIDQPCALRRIEILDGDAQVVARPQNGGHADATCGLAGNSLPMPIEWAAGGVLRANRAGG
jgi:hypothetical protein